MKKIGLIAFLLLSSIGFFAYSASPVPGCENACYTNVSYASGTFGLTFPINKWVEFCSLSPVPGTGRSCSQASTTAEFESCVANFCPFLPNLISGSGNSQCGTCLSVPVPGESLLWRIVRCTGTYIDTDAANCVMRPQNMSVLAGNWATFKLPAGINPAATVQWQMSTDNGANFSPAPGGTLPAYGLSAVLGLHGSQYRALWTNIYGPLLSSPATLSVSSLTQPAALMYLSNVGGQGMVEVYNASSGAHLSSFTPVDSPKGIVVDPAAGSVLVTSPLENQILKFNGQTAAPMGVFVDGTISCSGSALNGPAGITFGPDSHLYVADTGNNRVVKYDGLTGSCQGSYASTAVQDGLNP